MDLTSVLAATDQQGNWHFGIGDPTPIGWLTVVAYALATLASALVWAADRRASRQGRLSSPLFWMVLTFLLLFLGINKQLDLQTLLGDVGRRMAKAQGWYSQRRVYQVVFIAGVTAVGLVALGVFSWLGRREWRRNFVALLGTVFLYVFVLVRASSIHHVDAMLRWTWKGWTWNWILELGGIAVVTLGAWRARRRYLSHTGERSTGAGPDRGTGPRTYSFERGVVVVRGEGKSRPPD